MDTNTTFSERLRAWRKKSGLSQGSAAKRLGISRSYLNEVENGRPPGRKLVNSLSAAENPADFSTNEACRAAFESLIEALPLERLINHVNEVMRDESKPIEARLRIANAIMPTIERRKAELDKVVDSHAGRDLTSVAKNK